MNDIFTRTEVAFGGAMTAQFGIVTPMNGLTGILMQNITLGYQQQISRLYELGNVGSISNVYYVSGRASGTMSTGHVVGPGVAIAAFYSNFGDVCQAANNTLNMDLSPNLCGANVSGAAAAGGGLGAVAASAAAAATQVAYTAKYCVLTTVGMSVAAQDFVVNESSTLMFSGLAYVGP